MDFTDFPKIPRLSREVVISEKIDGTNAQVLVVDQTPEHIIEPSLIVATVGNLLLFAGSRNRWITTKDDNYGFAKWVSDNAKELVSLGAGRHFGEWWGNGIQRNYSQTKKRFSLFNSGKWIVPHYTPAGPMPPLSEGQSYAPDCCDVVPVLFRGPLEEYGVMKGVKQAMKQLEEQGSAAAPGFMQPEGIVIYHVAAGLYFKKTLEKDAEHKGKQ